MEGKFIMISLMVILTTFVFCLDAYFPMLNDRPKKEKQPKKRSDRKFILENEENEK